MAEVALITGFPRLLARGLLRWAMKNGPDHRVMLLVATEDMDQARAFLALQPAAWCKRLELLEGRLGDVDLGLSGETVERLLDEVTLVFHAASQQTGPRAQIRKGNVRALSAVLMLARDMRRLSRISFFSTVFVSGDRSGTIHEEELDCGQRLRTAYEQSMFLAEKLARESMPRLPITVLRPGSMIGHSQTGEAIGLTDGPNYLVKLMVRLPAEMPFFLPGSGVVPFNIVPIDYVVRAAWALARAPEAAGRTFHLTDPNPLSARQAFDLLGDLANRPAPFIGEWPNRILLRGLKMSGLRRLAPNKVALFEDLSTHVTYNCSGTLELLARAGISCPPFESYADTLVAWVAEYERSEKRTSPEVG